MYYPNMYIRKSPPLQGEDSSSSNPNSSIETFFLVFNYYEIPFTLVVNMLVEDDG